MGAQVPILYLRCWSQVAARKATLDSGRPALCCKFEPGSHVRPINWLWTRTDPDGSVSEVTPDIMSESDFVEQLALMYEGALGN